MAGQGLGSPQESPELWGQGAGQGGTAAPLLQSLWVTFACPHVPQLLSSHP